MKSVQVSVSLSLELLERVEAVARVCGERRMDALRRVIAIGVDSVLAGAPSVARPDPRERDRALALEVAQERLGAMRVRYQMWREQTGQWADNGPGKLKNEEWTRRVRIAELAVLRAGGVLGPSAPSPATPYSALDKGLAEARIAKLTNTELPILDLSKYAEPSSPPTADPSWAAVKAVLVNPTT